MTFTELGISDEIIRALDEHKITEPTEIQVQAIPHINESDRDLVAIAQTGTGKTAAFCLPVLQQIDTTKPQIQALVLVPTRELGQQVAREFFLFSKYMPRVFTECVYGGSPIEEQIKKLQRSTHVVVATPGRLLDLLDRKALSLDHIRYLILDEADEMMSMGFKTDIDEVLRSCRHKVQKMLFTATLPADVTQIISTYIGSDAYEIRVNADEKINEKIKHRFVIYEKGLKLEYLKTLLADRRGQRGILFCRTKIAAKRLAKQLAGFVVTADALHGNLNQEAREKVLRGFRKERIDLLIATDIAARGLDVKDLDYVIHYHLPEQTDYYTHRSGRTARAGKTGVSICLVKMEEMAELNALESELGIRFSAIALEIEPDTTPVQPITVYMNMGLNQDFDSGSLREYLVEEAGLNMADITNVQVDDEQSQFDIPDKYQEQLFLNLKGVKRACRNMKMVVNTRKNMRIIKK